MLKTASKGPLSSAWPFTESDGFFTTDSGVRYSWHSLDAFNTFVGEEVKFWQRLGKQIHRKLGKELPTEFQTGWKRGINALDLIHHGPAHLAMVELLHLFDDYRTLAIPTRRSTSAQLLSNAAQSDNAKHLSDFLDQVIAPVAPQVTHAEVFPSRHYDYILEKKYDDADIHLKEISEIRQQADGSWRHLTTISESAFQLSEKVKTEVPQAIEDAKSIVLEDRSLEEAQSYWNKRFAWHFGFAIASFIAFGAGVAFFIWVGIPNLLTALQLTPHTPNEGEGAISAPQSDETSWLITFVRLGVPALLVIWVLRTLLSVFREQTRYAVDAKERATMVRAYHSLHVMTKLTEADRHLMLRSLFRPSNAAVDDEPMPSYIDALVNRFGPGKGTSN